MGTSPGKRNILLSALFLSIHASGTLYYMGFLTQEDCRFCFHSSCVLTVHLFSYRHFHSQLFLFSSKRKYDHFEFLLLVKMIMTTNRRDVLDPTLLYPGRLDRKIEIPLANEQWRMEILKIHATGIGKHGEIEYEAVVKLAEGFNGADLHNVCTEVGMSAIRAERDYVIHQDFMKAVWKLDEAKKLEYSAHYSTEFGKD